MNRQKVIGAISFPAFLLAWTTGAVVAVGQLDLDRTPSDTCEVTNGNWQPVSRGDVPTTRAAVLDTAPATARARAMTVAAMERPVRARVMALAPGPKPEWVVEPQPVGRLAPPVETARPAIRPVPGSIATAAADSRVAPAAVVRKAPSRRLPRLAGLKARAREDLLAGRYSDAYHRLRPNVGEARADEEYLALLALAAMRMDSYGEAMVIYQRLARVQPDRPRWHAGLALARERLGLDSTRLYREALALSEGADDLRALLEAKLAGESFG